MPTPVGNLIPQSPKRENPKNCLILFKIWDLLTHFRYIPETIYSKFHEINLNFSVETRTWLALALMVDLISNNL